MARINFYNVADSFFVFFTLFQSISMNIFYSLLNYIRTLWKILYGNENIVLYVPAQKKSDGMKLSDIGRYATGPPFPIQRCKSLTCK